MKIGIPKEVKDKENRVALTPFGAKKLIEAGNEIFIERNAGINSGYENIDYEKLGAKIVSTDEAWAVDMVMKVKEPIEQEYSYLNDQIVFTYFHLAGVPKSLTESLVEAKTTAVAYETVEGDKEKLPLLAPMSAVAGNMSVTVGSYYLAKFNGGKGMQLGGVMGRKYGKVIVIGDGIVGKHAAKTAFGMGSNVFLFSRHEERFDSLKKEIGDGLNCVLSNPENIAEQIKDADLVVGGVLLAGAKAPYVVTEEMVKTMQPGSVIVDVSIDQGGCIETAKPTKHSDPIYVLHGVIHYCVTNMPGAYPRTSTIALTDATLPYALKLADKGIGALMQDKKFGKGLNTYNGFITYRPVAEALSMMDKFKELNEIQD
jgi:alanine dehydrogenase